MSETPIATDELDDTALDAVSGGVGVTLTVAGQPVNVELLPGVEPQVAVGHHCPHLGAGTGTAVPTHVAAL